MPTCPECQATLPEGTAFQRGGAPGLPDQRSLDCPYCGAPLEPLRWRHLLLLAVVLAVALAARQLIEPLLDWKIVAAACLLVVAHHVRAIWRWRKRQREADSTARVADDS